MYSVTTRYCPNAEAREELVHLFQGCDDTSCCLGGITVPTPESATMATASGSGILTMSSQTSPCFLGGMKVPGSSDDPDSISTSSVSHSDVTNTSSATPISVMQIKGVYCVPLVQSDCLAVIKERALNLEPYPSHGLHVLWPARPTYSPSSIHYAGLVYIAGQASALVYY